MAQTNWCGATIVGRRIRDHTRVCAVPTESGKGGPVHAYARAGRRVEFKMNVGTGTRNVSLGEEDSGVGTGLGVY